MSPSPSETAIAEALSVSFSDDAFTLELADGRTVAVPIAWYPRLLHGSGEERRNWTLTGGGIGVHWPDLDEDISVQHLLAGRRSGETQASLQRWLESRRETSPS
jgi:hypothetical protein